MISAISIAIPTLNNLKGLKKLIFFFKKTNYSVIVIDNQPTDEKKELFNSLNKRQFFYYPQLKNLGFAKAINFALKSIKTEWSVILNDDVEITDENLFEKLLNYARENNSIAVSPVLKKANGQIENLGYKVLPIGRIKLITDKPRNNCLSSTIDGLTAACLLIKTQVFLKSGGFDQRFFAYLEDVDLFLRLKKREEKYGVCFETEVIHNHLTTSSKIKGFKEFHDFKNWLFVIIKNWDKKTLFSYFPQIVVERLRNLSGLIKKVFL